MTNAVRASTVSTRPRRPARLVRIKHRSLRTARHRQPMVEPAPVGALRLPESEAAASTVTSNARWARTLREFSRFAVWSVPAYAVAMILSLFWRPGGERIVDAVVAWFGVVGLTALVALLAGTRTRFLALAGLLTGVAGMLLAQPGVAQARSDGMALLTDADLRVRVVALLAGVLLTTGWVLAGLAVVRGGVLNSSDGKLIIAAAPLVGLGWAVLGALAAIGAPLLLAGAVGVAWTGTRLT